MKFCMGNKLTFVNRFILQNLNSTRITNSAIITRKKIGILKCGGGGGWGGNEPRNLIIRLPCLLFCFGLVAAACLFPKVRVIPVLN